jgi:hypothetical protein
LWEEIKLLSPRVAVPWGPEPKAQVVSGLGKRSSWIHGDDPPPKKLYFEDLFHDEVEIAVFIKNPPTPLALQKLTIVDERPDLSWGTVKTFTPRPNRVQMAALPSGGLSVASIGTARWAEAIAKQARAPRSPRSQVSALPQQATPWADLPRRKTVREPLNYRDFSSIGSKTEVAALNPVMPSSLAQRRTNWEQMPPEIIKWAQQKGIAEGRLPTTRPVISALPSRKQAALAALQAGEWVCVDDLDIFPPRLRRWLQDCDVVLIRWFGGAGISAIPGVPVNGYVTEDGQIFYVAEDNSTFYVQET